ncbi:MAG: PAAR domain-containing protein [Methyloceanibacter sp.]
MTRFAATLLLLVAAALALTPLVSLAEDNPNPLRAGTVTSGGGDVVVEGKQAARAGDTAGCAGSTIVQGSPNVFINGKPAAVQG